MTGGGFPGEFEEHPADFHFEAPEFSLLLVSAGSPTETGAVDVGEKEAV